MENISGLGDAMGGGGHICHGCQQIQTVSRPASTWFLNNSWQHVPQEITTKHTTNEWHFEPFLYPILNGTTKIDAIPLGSSTPTTYSNWLKTTKSMTQWLNALTAPVAWWKPPWDITKSPASHLAWWLAYIIQDDTNSILLHLKQRMRLLTSSSVKSSPVMMRLRIKRVSPIQVQNIRRVWFKNDSSISYQSYRSDKHLEDCNEYDRI